MAFALAEGPMMRIAAVLVAIANAVLHLYSTPISRAHSITSSRAVVLEKLQTFPALKQAIHAWLSAGVMDSSIYSPSETGIAQGGVLSPLLMNIALHGMEAAGRRGRCQCLRQGTTAIGTLRG